MEDETFAQKLRNAGEQSRRAQIAYAKADAEYKRVVAVTKTIAGEKRNLKTDAAQNRWADEQVAVYEARLAIGVAKGNLDAARCEVMAVETEFKIWQSKQADLRFERRVYGG